MAIAGGRAAARTLGRPIAAWPPDGSAAEGTMINTASASTTPGEGIRRGKQRQSAREHNECQFIHRFAPFAWGAGGGVDADFNSTCFAPSGG